MKIFIIIVHFGNPKVTKKCIKSVSAAGLNFTELIVVDNNQNFNYGNFNNKIKIIKSKKNLGFAGGVNVGIRQAMSKGADYILLLNNDTVIRQDFTKVLLSFSEKFENAGIVSPAIKFKNGGKVIYDIGGKINKIFGRTTHKQVRKTKKTVRIVDYVSGCCMLIKTEVIKKTGLFDERFFLYYEDVDFCLRAKNNGFLVYVLPEVSIEHALSKTVGKVSSLAVYHQTQSAIRFGKKHFKIRRALNSIFILVQSFVIFGKNPKSGKFSFLAIYRNL